jgi:hypothetical protein
MMSMIEINLKPTKRRLTMKTKSNGKHKSLFGKSGYKAFKAGIKVVAFITDEYAAPIHFFKDLKKIWAAN